MIEHHHILVQDIDHVRCIVFRQCRVLHVDVLKVPHRIERGEPEEPHVLHRLLVPIQVEGIQELVDQGIAAVLLRNQVLQDRAVGEHTLALSVADAHLCQRANPDEGTAVLTPVIVRTLHEGALGV